MAGGHYGGAGRRLEEPGDAVTEPRPIDRPAPGFWLMRQVKRGPLVPAAIMLVQTAAEPGEPGNLMERSPFLAAFIAGEPVDIAEIWEHRGTEISADEYEFQLRVVKWAQEHSPDDPLANPKRPVDISKLAPPF